MTVPEDQAPGSPHEHEAVEEAKPLPEAEANKDEPAALPEVVEAVPSVESSTANDNDVREVDEADNEAIREVENSAVETGDTVEPKAETEELVVAEEVTTAADTISPSATDESSSPPIENNEV